MVKITLLLTCIFSIFRSGRVTVPYFIIVILRCINSTHPVVTPGFLFNFFQNIMKWLRKGTNIHLSLHTHLSYTVKTMKIIIVTTFSSKTLLSFGSWIFGSWLVHQLLYHLHVKLCSLCWTLHRDIMMLSPSV